MKRLDDHVIPGSDGKKELLTYLYAMLILVVLWALTFYISYFNARSLLYTLYRGEKVLIKDSVMTPFSVLVKGRFIGTAAYAGLCVFKAAYNLISFRTGSKSIYLMKRLPDRFEAEKRSLIMPFAALVTGLAAALLLFLAFRASYIALTPAGHFPGYDTYSLWRLL